LEEDRLRELLLKLLRGDLGSPESRELLDYLENLLKLASRRLGERLRREQESQEIPSSLVDILLEENPVEDLVQEFILHLLSKKRPILTRLEDSSNIRGYLLRCAENFLIDLHRSTKRHLPLQETGESERGGGVEEEIQLQELFELEELFLSRFRQEDLKYVCYLLSSARYKCLWKDRSDSAIYKDVERNRKRIVELLRLIVKEAGADRELWQEFIRLRLSAICEDIRSKECGEER